MAESIWHKRKGQVLFAGHRGSVYVWQFQRLLGQHDCFWPSVHETLAGVDQDQEVFPWGQPILHHQGYTQMSSYPSDVEEALVPAPGTRAGGALTLQNV